MHEWRRHKEEALHVGLRWRLPMNQGVGSNEGQVLTLQRSVGCQ